MIDFTQSFAIDYAGARAKFRAAAAALGASVVEYRHPLAAPDGSASRTCSGTFADASRRTREIRYR